MKARAYKHYGTKRTKHSLDLEQPTPLGINTVQSDIFVQLNCELIHPVDEKGQRIRQTFGRDLFFQSNGFPSRNWPCDTATTAGGQPTTNDSDATRRLRLRIPDADTSRAANSMSDLSGRFARAVSSNVLRLQLLSTMYRAHRCRQEGMSNLQRGKF